MTMTRTHYMTFERDNETEVTVEYTITPYDPGNTYGPAENCYPPEGGEVEIVKVFSDTDPDIKWTNDEDQKWSQKIFEDHDFDDCDDYEDWRDEA
jgi:hypothetical protein